MQKVESQNVSCLLTLKLRRNHTAVDEAGHVLGAHALLPCSSHSFSFSPALLLGRHNLVLMLSLNQNM